MASPVSRDLSLERAENAKQLAATWASNKPREQKLWEIARLEEAAKAFSQHDVEIERVRALVGTSTALLIHLTRGGVPNAPAALAMEGEIVKAASSLARQDTFAEWADYCGVEL